MKNKLPLEYRWLKAHGLNGLSPWYFLENQKDIDSLRKQYSIEVGRTKDIYPFARRYDMDDIAGFVIDNGAISDRVAAVHLTWSSSRQYDGYPRTHYYDSFFEWFVKDAIVATKELVSEEDLEDYLQEQAQK